MSARSRAFVVAALAALCAGALLVDRSLQFFIGRDSSLFLYVARRVQEGGVPYRDVWDHKPPLIYYLDVIGVTLADRGIPGVAVVEFASMFVAAVVGFWALHRTLGLVPALFGVVAWTTAIAVMLEGGNRPEEYALPLQFGAIALYLAERRSGPSRWRWTLVGITAAFALLLKPTLLGMWAAIYLAEAARAWHLRSLGAVTPAVLLGAVGFFAVILPVGVYLVATGAASDFVDQVIRFNIEYSRSSVADRLDALAAGVKLTLFSGLLPVAVVGWVTALVQLARRTGAVARRPLLLVAVLALPLDFALASATGRPYREYFLGCLAAQGILAAGRRELGASGARRHRRAPGTLSSPCRPQRSRHLRDALRERDTGRRQLSQRPWTQRSGTDSANSDGVRRGAHRQHGPHPVLGWRGWVELHGIAALAHPLRLSVRAVYARLSERGPDRRAAPCARARAAPP